MSQLTSNQSLGGYRPPSKRMPSFLFPQMDDPNTDSHALKQSVISNFQHSQYSIMCKAPISQLIIFQAIATFIFVFGCTSIYNPIQNQVHTLYAVFLLFAICISGSLTGANINPSITISNYLRKQNKYTLRMIPIYFTGQFIGIIIALIASIYINEIDLQPITPQSDDIIVILRQICNEMMGTIIMVFFILEITNPNTTFIQNQISGYMSIVLFFFLSIVLCPQTNSFAINFAITLAVNICASIFNNQHDGWVYIWIYLLGDIIGVLVAVVFYDKVFQPIIKKLRQVRRQSLSYQDFTDANDQD